jgi:dihydroorotate dehydrogenase electron transfer subunit
MFEALHAILLEVRPTTELQALLEARMACGFGVCYSCAVFPKTGGAVKLVCTDGPMINSRTLYG